jgi:hypothetical protein
LAGWELAGNQAPLHIKLEKIYKPYLEHHSTKLLAEYQGRLQISR